MEYKEGQEVFAKGTIFTKPGRTLEKGDSFIIIRVSGSWLMGEGVVCRSYEVSPYPCEEGVKNAFEQMKKEIYG